MKLNDITTDLSNPPRFDLPGGKARPDFDPATAEEHRRKYPGLSGLIMAKAPEAAYAQAVAVAEGMGWRIAAKDSGARRFEAVATTRIFRFKDDIAVRIASHDEGALVDVRSKSRVGKDDLGTNAKRIRAFLGKLGVV